MGFRQCSTSFDSVGAALIGERQIAVWTGNQAMMGLRSLRFVCRVATWKVYQHQKRDRRSQKWDARDQRHLPLHSIPHRPTRAVKLLLRPLSRFTF
jgi:hypothetical protein